jgi:hypothetical protein
VRRRRRHRTLGTASHGRWTTHARKQYILCGELKGPFCMPQKTHSGLGRVRIIGVLCAQRRTYPWHRIHVETWLNTNLGRRDTLRILCRTEES